jgi:hypothetical protein
MKPHHIWVAALLAGCVGRSMSDVYNVSSAAPSPDVFACVRDSLKTVGFRQTSYDTDEYRLIAQRYNEDVTRPDVMFRRLIDRVEFEIDPGTEGAMTQVTATAKTFAELSTQRGPTEEQEKTSDIARQAAQSLLDKCVSPVDSTKVPG